MVNSPRKLEAQALGFVNDYDLLRKYGEATGDRTVCISYRAADRGRGGYCAAWQVMSPFFNTDPTGYWRDYRKKTFDVFARDEKESQLEAAKAWAAETYNEREWKKTSRLFTTGTLFPARVVDWLEALIKAAK